MALYNNNRSMDPFAAPRTAAPTGPTAEQLAQANANRALGLMQQGVDFNQQQFAASQNDPMQAMIMQRLQSYLDQPQTNRADPNTDWALQQQRALATQQSTPRQMTPQMEEAMGYARGVGNAKMPFDANTINAMFTQGSEMGAGAESSLAQQIQDSASARGLDPSDPAVQAQLRQLQQSRAQGNQQVMTNVNSIANQANASTANQAAQARASMMMGAAQNWEDRLQRDSENDYSRRNAALGNFTNLNQWQQGTMDQRDQNYRNNQMGALTTMAGVNNANQDSRYRQQNALTDSRGQLASMLWQQQFNEPADKEASGVPSYQQYANRNSGGNRQLPSTIGQTPAGFQPGYASSPMVSGTQAAVGPSFPAARPDAPPQASGRPPAAGIKSTLPMTQGAAPMTMNGVKGPLLGTKKPRKY